MNLSFNIHSERGDAFLEFVLFMPLLFLLIFGGTDFGYHLIDSAAVEDIVRSSIASAGRSNDFNSLAFLDNDFQYHTRVTECDKVASQISANIVSSFAEKWGKANVSDDLNVKVRIYQLPIDTDSGRMLSTTGDLISSSESGAFNIFSEVADYPLLTPENYLHSELEAASSSSAISPYAIPLQYDGSTGRFLPSTLMIYSEVTLRTRGMFPEMVRSLLKRAYVSGRQEISLLRNQLG